MPNIIHYRNKCIGCGICYEMMPECWRMSKKDGRATLLHSILKKGIYIAVIDESLVGNAQMIANACPVKVIKVNK